MITRNRIISSIEDKKMISKVLNVDPVDDIASHFLSIELYDPAPEIRGILDTKKYNYFSCYKNYQQAFKQHSGKELADALMKFFNEFNESSPLMDFDETVQHICFIHRNHAKELSQLSSLLQTKEYKELNPSFNFFDFNQMLITTKDPKKEIFLCKYIDDLRIFLNKNNGNMDQYSESENFDDKLFLIFSELERIPVISHLGIILGLMHMGLNEVWLESPEFDLKKLIDKVQHHILDSKSILGAKMKGTFKKSLEKMVMGDHCTQSTVPVINPKNKLFGLLSHFKMLTNTVQKYNTYHEIIQRTAQNADQMEHAHRQEVKIFMLSWNLAGYKPDLKNGQGCSQLINQMFSHMEDPDLIVVNFQEIVEMKANADVVMGLFSQDVKNYRVWAKFFNNNFIEAYPDYVFDNHKNLLGLGVFIFIHKRKLKDINHIRTKKIKFGLMGAVPNKGTIMDSYQIHDNIIVFSNSHLPSGQKKENIKTRADKVEEIMDACRSKTEFQYDLMYITGDLNLRCFADFPFETRKLNELEQISQEEYLQKSNEYLNCDETKLPDTPHKILGPLFVEGESPRFPTYKVKRGLEEGIYVEDRRPSWTDRIFFHNKGKVELEPVVTKSTYIKFSDHL